MSHISHLISQNYAIIVAGGSGARMQSATPKQFLLLNGKPVLMHTIEAFYNCASKPTIIIVLPAAFRSTWEKLCREYQFDIPHSLVNGGETRFHSVKNALEYIQEDGEAVIAIQDAVRPLTSRRIIDESYKHAAIAGNAITAVKSRDSIRQVKDGRSMSLTRDEIYLVQTPQTFLAAQIKKAYRQPYNEKFTDDASVAEAAGFPVSLIEGDHRNIKITFPGDIALAESLITKK